MTKSKIVSKSKAVPRRPRGPKQVIEDGIASRTRTNATSNVRNGKKVPGNSKIKPKPKSKSKSKYKRKPKPKSKSKSKSKPKSKSKAKETSKSPSIDGNEGKTDDAPSVDDEEGKNDDASSVYSGEGGEETTEDESRSETPELDQSTFSENYELSHRQALNLIKSRCEEFKLNFTYVFPVFLFDFISFIVSIAHDFIFLYHFVPIFGNSFCFISILTNF